MTFDNDMKCEFTRMGSGYRGATADLGKYTIVRNIVRSHSWGILKDGTYVEMPIFL